VAKRHAALRLVIDSASFTKGVDPKPSYQWRELDWSYVARKESEQKLEAFLREDWERGFNFDEGVPIRFALLHRATRALDIGLDRASRAPGWPVISDRLAGMVCSLRWSRILAEPRGL
jgi:hypothetical protein